ncbi:MAG: hypothetical protein OWT28_04715, partial [Firmicutes bacterium]|nr:hypothetical protein [Bacillota bacterium]
MSGSAWTNGAITQPFTGIETDMAIGGNDGIEQVPALEIANKQAMNGYGPGDYIFTSIPVIQGNGVNPDYARHILDQFGFTLVDRSTEKTDIGYYAGSDVYVLSGYDNAPNPYSNPYYYASGQYVHLIPIARPSIRITSGTDHTTGRSGLGDLAPGDSVSVTDAYNAKDTAPPQWGHAGAILAYWYFHGVYTNAFAGSHLDVPEYGFGPYQGTYQPGSAPANALTLTVPHRASGNGELILYYVDGIDRFAEATAPVYVASVCPTMAFLGTNASGEVSATASTTTADLRESGGRAGDVIDWVVSGGTFSGGTTHQVSTLSSSGFASVQVRQTPGDSTAIVTAVDASFPACSALKETVKWPIPPRISLSADPTSLDIGASSTLSVHALHLQANEHVVVIQTDGIQGTLRGNGESNRMRISYDVAQTNSSFASTPTATDQTAQTLHYTAQVQSESGRPLAAATPVAITWRPKPSVTLSITPTTSQTVGARFTLIAHAKNVNPQNRITITEIKAPDPGTLNGATKASWPSPGTYGAYDFRANATSSKAQIVTYQADILDASTDKTVATSTAVSATWTALPARPPTLSLVVNDAQPTIGNPVILTMTSTDLQRSYGLYLHDVSADRTLQGDNMAGPGGTVTHPTWATKATDATAQTVTYQATQEWKNPATDQVQVIRSHTVQVTWHAPMAPTVTLVASSPTEAVNTPDSLTAMGSNLPADSTIVLLDLSGHTLTTPDHSPSATGGYDWVGSANSAVPTTDSFTAEVVSSVGQVLVESKKVSITWMATAVPRTETGELTLRASALSETVGQTDGLTASTTYAVGGHKAIFLHDVSGDQTLGGQNLAQGNPGAASLTVRAMDEQAQTVTYQAALQLADGRYVHSNVLTVTWVPEGAGGVGASTGPSGSVGTPVTTVCPPPMGPPPQPPARLDRVTWSTTSSGARQVTWQDSHYVLLSAVSSGANSCPFVSYQWVDQPVTYTHVYPQTVTGLQVTSLYADPGTPFDPWSPGNRAASQQNGDAYTNGSTIGGQPLPTFGNPTGSPAVYLRVGGALGFRLQWIGSPDDQVVRALAYFTLTNPDGSTRTWSTSLHLLSATAFRAGTTVQVGAGANGYPPSASIYMGGFTTIPKYAIQPALGLIQWNLSGNPATAAILQATVRVQTDYAEITWQKTDLAQMFGYPVWYFNHEI